MNNTAKTPQEPPKQHIAVFDLDLTITKWDTTLPYLFGWAASRPRYWLKMPALFWQVVQFKRGKLTNHQLKTTFYTRLMQAADPAKEQQWTAKYNRFLIKHGLYSAALAAIKQHQDAGDTLVLASASVDIYVMDLAAQLGFKDVICTRMQRDDQGRLTGKIDGNNLLAENKLSAVQEYLTKQDWNHVHLTFYSDSGSDLPLFQHVHRAIAINPDNKFKADQLGFEVLRWK